MEVVDARGWGNHASESDSSKPGPSFFAISPTSRISPQSRHSSYWASLSLAISCVRVCWQADGFILATGPNPARL